MRIAVLGVQVPFSRGGAELLAEGLCRELVAAGHRVDLVTLPFNDVDRSALLASMAAWRALDFERFADGPIDLVIATKFPSTLARHPRKVAWLIHQYRGVYDFSGTSYTNVHPDRLPDAALRETILEADRRAFSECRAVYTISRTVSERLADYCGIESTPLHHPPPHLGTVREPSAGEGILAVSRLERNKRLDLLVETLAKTKSRVKCRIVGTGSQEPHLRHLIEQYGLGARVELVGDADDESLRRLYAVSRAVWFAPFDEDYGYVTLEAFSAGTPVVTSDDSGGVLEFVRDGETGFVCAPEPDAMARVLDRFEAEPELAVRLGRAGLERVRGIRWTDVVEALVGAAG